MNPIRLHRRLRPGLLVFLLCLAAAAIVGRTTIPTTSVERADVVLEVDAQGQQVAVAGETRRPLESAVAAGDAAVQADDSVDAEGQLVYETSDTGERQYYLLSVTRHWRWWSFLPAFTAIALCWITKEPLPALLGGVVVGGVLIGKEDILSEVLIPALGRPKAATILVLYLWLLGGLLGIWSRTGATRAFADDVAARFVRGPRSAKVVGWVLGVLFFQGGTISSVLAGTTIRPVADRQRVSHEELSLIVDATSSPVAVLLPFNAWPIYVQALMTVPGAAYLATETDRLAFFFDCVPLFFFAWLSVGLALLVAAEWTPWLPARLRKARERAATTGALDGPDAEPLGLDDLADRADAGNDAAHSIDFALPLATLLGVAIGSYLWSGTPEVLWAFCGAVAVAAVLAAWRGMTLKEIVLALVDGQKSVVLGSIILLLAITVGGLSQETGGGLFLVSLLGDFPWYWLLPATLFAIAAVISFSTGSSWATFAVTLPLAMPLAHALGLGHDLSHPWLFDAVCFAACLNGAVFGDQCSPISDTTVLTAMCTGADLMDHVKSQLPVAAIAVGLALVGWTGLALWAGA